MAEIINDAEIKAVEDLTDKFNRLGNVLDTIIAKGEENKTVIEQSKAVGELSKKIADLEKNQEALVNENKKLKEAQDKATKSAESQSEAMESLDEHTGGFIARAKEMGKQLWALARNPFILMLATIIAAFAAMASAVRTFFTATGEGEDILNRQTAVWNQFFNTLKKGWKDLGKSVAEALGEEGLTSVLYNFLRIFSDEMAASFMKTQKEARELADIVDDIETRMAINIVKRAETELEYNRLSRQAEMLKLEDQAKALAALEEGIKVKERQLAIDKELAKQSADATLYQIGLEHGLTKEMVDRMSFEERDAEFTGEEMKRIAEAYANVINLEAKYEQEVRRNTTKIITFKEQMRLAAVKEATRLAEDEIRQAQRSVDIQISEVQRAARMGEITVKEAEERIQQIKEETAADTIEKQIRIYQQLINMEELNADERAAIDIKLWELRRQLHDAYFASIKENYRLTFEDITAMYVDFTSSLGDLFASITERRLQEIDIEEKKMEEMYNKELELAGDNDEAKAEIEKRAEKRREQLEKRRLEAQRRAAVFDKIISATQAGIQTSLAIIRMLANPGGPAGVAMSIAAGITGAAQVAAILSRPIPQYKDGGRTTADIILAGEEGIEMYRTPSGEVGFTPNRPTIMKLPIGTEIKNHRETMKELAANGITGITDFAGTGDDVQWALYNKLNSIETTIKNKREVHYNWTRKGLEKAFKNGESRTYWMDNFFN